MLLEGASVTTEEIVGESEEGLACDIEAGERESVVMSCSKDSPPSSGSASETPSVGKAITEVVTPIKASDANVVINLLEVTPDEPKTQTRKEFNKWLSNQVPTSPIPGTSLRDPWYLADNILPTPELFHTPVRAVEEIYPSLLHEKADTRIEPPRNPRDEAKSANLKIEKELDSLKNRIAANREEIDANLERQKCAKPKSVMATFLRSQIKRLTKRNSRLRATPTAKLAVQDSMSAAASRASAASTKSERKSHESRSEKK